MHYLVILGTIRDSTPPKPPRLGLRVAKACLAWIEEQQEDCTAELIDPLDFDLGTVFKPHFSYAPGKAPPQLDTLAQMIAAADGYVMVSPEYNHSISPALTHLLNHFGSSLFAYKPSAIVTYSAGQWGGVRAAAGMRVYLSELGCLPVSAMIHVPKAQQVFTEDGDFADGVDTQRWTEYMDRAFTQLYWWADAASAQRRIEDPHTLIQDFTKDPSQRNAPDDSE